MSRTASHHSSNDAAAQVTVTSSTDFDLETTRRHDRPQAIRVGEPKWPRRFGVRRLDVSELDGGAARRSHPRVELRTRPDGEHGPTAGAQNARDLGADALHLGHEHQPKPAQDSIDVVVGQRQPGGVFDGEANVRQAECGSSTLRRLDHLRRYVGGHQFAARLSPREREKPCLALSRCELENPLTRPRVEQLDHSRRQPRRRAPEHLAPPLPARGDATPGLDLVDGAAGLCRHALELRDDVLAVGRERLLLPVGHQVDRIVIDADRLQLP